jgi:hypothetical protein
MNALYSSRSVAERSRSGVPLSNVSMRDRSADARIVCSVAGSISIFVSSLSSEDISTILRFFLRTEDVEIGGPVGVVQEKEVEDEDEEDEEEEAEGDVVGPVTEVESVTVEVGDEVDSFTTDDIERD